MKTGWWARCEQAWRGQTWQLMRPARERMKHALTSVGSNCLFNAEEPKCVKTRCRYSVTQAAKVAWGYASFLFTSPSRFFDAYLA
jgi:hypothetical protein